MNLMKKCAILIIEYALGERAGLRKGKPRVTGGRKVVRPTPSRYWVWGRQTAEKILKGILNIPGRSAWVFFENFLKVPGTFRKVTGLVSKNAQIAEDLHCQLPVLYKVIR